MKPKFAFTVATKSGRVVSGKIRTDEDDITRVKQVFRKVALKEVSSAVIVLGHEIFDGMEIESLKIKKVLF